jgi:hypothetical protein
MAFVLILFLALSACEGAATNVPQEDQEPGDIPEDDGMVFTEGDILESDSEEEFVFSEDDLEDDDPQPVPPGDVPAAEDEDPGMVFPEDEAEEITEDPAVILPPVGVTIWEITHEDGTIVCPTFTETFGEGEVEIVRTEVSSGPDQFAMLLFAPDGEDFIPFQRNFGNPVAEYNGDMLIPGTSDKLHFQIFFDNLEGGSIANYMYGTISSEAGGCLTTRDFTGVFGN